MRRSSALLRIKDVTLILYFSGNWPTYVGYRTKTRGGLGGSKNGVVASDALGGDQRPGNGSPSAETGNAISSLAHEINNPIEALHQLHYLIEKEGDRKSTRLNSSHAYISYAV